jgi:hypothetical protein
MGRRGSNVHGHHLGQYVIPYITMLRLSSFPSISVFLSVSSYFAYLEWVFVSFILFKSSYFVYFNLSLFLCLLIYSEPLLET